MKKKTKKNKNLGKKLHIRWEDHFSTNGRWFTIEELNLRPHINESVGMLVHEDDKAVVLASSWSTINNTFNDPVYILKSCIVSRKNMK